MKKRTLKEEIERIRTITYGKNMLFENDFLNKLLQGGDTTNLTPVDDPAKADYVDDNVKKFLSDLKSINHEVTQQSLGTMVYQKEVELIQIGLVLLGYELPQHGIDGYFGPETAAAVKKYKSDNNIISELYNGGGNVNIKDGVDTDIDPKLMSMIDAIASEYGKPFKITSGYRNPKRNKNVGGVEKSQHLYHKAVDVVLDDTSHEASLRFIQIASKNGISGIGVYDTPGFLHIDIGPRRFWGSDRSSGSLPAWAKSTIQAHMNNKIDAGYVSDDDNEYDDDDNESQGEMQKVSTEMIQSISSKLETKGVTKQELDKLVDKVTTGGGDIFTDLDLETEDGFKTYVNICEVFIRTRKPNPLGITGKMLADGAKSAFVRFHKYIPPELALGQLAAEGGIGNSDPKCIPVVTRNPFDVANTETGSKTYSTVQEAIDAYYSLIARKYLGQGKTANDLIYNFVNKDNQRYAGALSYENVVTSIAKKVRKISQSLENNV
jgi:hypothetical protein